MGKRLNKAIAVLSALVMLLGFIPAVFAEDGTETTQDTPVLSDAAGSEEPAADIPSQDEEQTASANDGEKPAAPSGTGAEQVAVPAQAQAGQPATVGTEEEPEDAVQTDPEQPAPSIAEEEPTAPVQTDPEQPVPVITEEEPAMTDEELQVPAATGEEQPAAAAKEEEPSIPASAAEGESVPDTTEEESMPEAAEGESVPDTAEEESIPEAAEEEGDQDEPNEPVELNVNGALYGRLTAGKEFIIELKTERAGTVLLTLTLNTGRKIRTRINDREVQFSRQENESSTKAVYTYEYKAAGKGRCFITLSADADVKFRMKAEYCSEDAAAASQTEETAEEAPAEENPAEEEISGEIPAEERPAEDDISGEIPAEENPAEEEMSGEIPAEEETDADPERKMLEDGFVKVMVIRENGTNLYKVKDTGAEAAGRLEHGEEVWIRAAGGMWGEICPDGEDAPLYFNLNNVVLLKGEVEYSIPIRKVRLTSTLEGLTEIEDGTEITMTAEFSGFAEDEIVDITWQYRGEDDEEGVFHNIEEAYGFDYSYRVSAENIHYEWRIILTLKA